MTAIEVHGLKVRLGGKSILNDLSLSVEAGTVCALLGPNGAGKTTLLKSLVNIHRKDAGTAAILGVPVEKLKADDFTRIGYVSESQELPLWMTVKEYLSFCRALYPKWDQEWEKQLLSEFDLEVHRYTRLKDLSRGMRVKAALISSLVYRPELLILDEPFSGLDPVVRDDFISAIINLAGEVGATTLISSHDLHEVERIADGIAFLVKGTVAAHESLDALVSRFKRITVELESEAKPTTFPKTWVKPTQEGQYLRFIDTQFDKEDLNVNVNEMNSNARISAVEDISLKDIYKVLVDKDVL